MTRGRALRLLAASVTAAAALAAAGCGGDDETTSTVTAPTTTAPTTTRARRSRPRPPPRRPLRRRQPTTTAPTTTRRPPAAAGSSRPDQARLEGQRHEGRPEHPRGRHSTSTARTTPAPAAEAAPSYVVLLAAAGHEVGPVEQALALELAAVLTDRALLLLRLCLRGFLLAACPVVAAREPLVVAARQTPMRNRSPSPHRRSDPQPLLDLQRLSEGDDRIASGLARASSTGGICLTSLYLRLPFGLRIGKPRRGALVLVVRESVS